MIHMKHGVALGCELLSEFRRNGSIDKPQQMIVNQSDGYIWLSGDDYREVIKPDRVYRVWIGGLCENDELCPVFSIALIRRKKFVAKPYHRDPFPSAVPEIRDKYKADGVEFVSVDLDGYEEYFSTYIPKYDGTR